MRVVTDVRPGRRSGVFGIETGRVICAACRELFSYRQVVWSFGGKRGIQVPAMPGSRENSGPGSPGH